MQKIDKLISDLLSSDMDISPAFRKVHQEELAQGLEVILRKELELFNQLKALSLEV